jgi:hypothetical protein
MKAVMQQQPMDDERAPKRVHESPAMPVRAPNSPGGTMYALALAGGGSSTESTPAARPAKSRNLGDELVQEECRFLKEASKTLAAKGGGRGRGGGSGRSGGRGVT